MARSTKVVAIQIDTKAGFSRLFHSGVNVGLVIFEEKNFCGMGLVENCTV